VVASTVHEETADDALPDIGAAIVRKTAEFLVAYCYFHAFQEPCQLFPYLSCTSQGTDLDVVFGAPLLTVLELDPGVVEMEESEVVTSWTEESLFGVVGVHTTVFGAEEDAAADREHSADGEDLIHTTVVLRTNQHLRLHRLQWKLGHPPTQTSQLSPVVKRTQCVQHLESLDKHVMGWWVKEVKIDQVVDPHTLQHQDHVAYVAALYLRNS
jgi:hypothetical protein